VPTVLSAIKSFFAAVSHAATADERASDARIIIVALLVEEQDRERLAGICRGHEWGVHFADTCGEASGIANRLKAPIIFCDRDLRAAHWRELVQVLAASPHNACVILISKVLDAYLWNEVGHAGGYDVLAKPLQEVEVVRAVKLAWSYWNTKK
jgi:FixJ family two-component response regulator